MRIETEYRESIRRITIENQSWDSMPRWEPGIESPSLSPMDLPSTPKPGRRYEEAVNTFQPYDRTKEVNEGAIRVVGRQDQTETGRLPSSSNRAYPPAA
jgi:hypothetical protein